MAKYRKKPVVIDAWRVSDLIDIYNHGLADLPISVFEAHKRGEFSFFPNRVLVYTLEGDMQGDFDDYIIRGVKGELYPCKPDVFKATYERVND